MVNSIQNHHKIHLIAHPSGQGKGYILWIQTLIHILSHSQSLKGHYSNVTNHWHVDWLLNCLFWHTSKKASKHHGLCEGNQLLSVGFPSQRASYTENVSIWWHYHGCINYHARLLYSALSVIFLWISHERHRIAGPWGHKWMLCIKGIVLSMLHLTVNSFELMVTFHTTLYKSSLNMLHSSSTTL